MEIISFIGIVAALILIILGSVRGYSRLCFYSIIHAATEKPTHIFPPSRGKKKTVPGCDAGHRLFFICICVLTRACSRS